LSAISVISTAVLLFLSYLHTITPAFYTLSLHDALPIYNFIQYAEIKNGVIGVRVDYLQSGGGFKLDIQNTKILNMSAGGLVGYRSEEHTSELQSRENLVCRLLLEKKNNSNARYFCKALA